MYLIITALQYIVIILLCLIWVIFAYFQYAYNYWRMKGVQYAPAWSIHGSTQDLGTTMHSAQFFQRMYKKFREKSAKCVGYYIFTVPVLLIIDLDLIEKILVTDGHNFTDRGIYSNKKDEPISANLFTMDEPEWSVIRHKLVHTFTPNHLRNMFNIVDGMGTRLCKQIDHHMRVKSSTIEIKDLFARYATDVIARCAFGHECNSLENPNTPFRLMGQAVFYPPHSRTVSLLKGQFKWLANKLHIKTFHDVVSSYFMDVVKHTVNIREELLRNGQRNPQQDTDLIDLLIELKNNDDPEKRITMEEVAAQAFVFYLAGFETSSSILAYCLYELAGSRHEQNKLRQEVRQIYRIHRNQLTYEIMKDKFIQMDKMIKETLRKHPPGPVIMRKAKNDYRIEHEKGNHFILKKGTHVIIPNYAIQHDAEYFENPEEFKATRFSKPLQRNMTWLPFGDGKRRCLGKDFGMMEVKVALAHILNSFEVSNRKEPLEYDPSTFFLTPVDGISLHFKTIY